MAAFHLWRGGSRAALAALAAPDIDADRCVHSRVVDAACRRCIDACPSEAWCFSDHELALDAARCDGCGLCVAACPEAALGQPYAPLPIPQAGVVFAACQRVAAIGDAGVIPCVHGISEQQVYGYALRGISILNLSRDDCDTCPRGARLRVERVLEDANVVLRSRGLAAVTAADMPVSSWRRALGAARSRQDVQAGRRRFLKLPMADGASRRLAADHETAAARQSLPASHGLPLVAGAVHPWVPQIDAQRCVGCDACMRICPTGALAEQAEKAVYGVDAARCNGCGLCRDVCEFAAVSLQRLEPAQQIELPFALRRCRACGSDYKVVGTAADDSVCRICRLTQRNRRLFQVIADG